MKNIEQSGRSMIEMLGVLAIIGILSVMSIVAYNKGMGQHRITKALDQVSSLSSNIRVQFASDNSYRALVEDGSAASKIVFENGLFPEDMIRLCASSAEATDNSSTCVQNAMNGKTYISVVGSNPREFSIVFEGLPKDACVTMANSDWGSSAGIRGLRIVKANNGIVSFGSSFDIPAGSSAETIAATAAEKCGACGGTDCAFAWTFF